MYIWKTGTILLMESKKKIVKEGQIIHNEDLFTNPFFNESAVETSIVNNNATMAPDYSTKITKQECSCKLALKLGKFLFVYQPLSNALSTYHFAMPEIMQAIIINPFPHTTI